MLASALQQRVLTALLLAPLAVAALLLLPTPYLALLLALVVVLAAWEWTTLAGITSNRGRGAYLLLVAGAMALLWQPAVRASVFPLLIAFSIWWCLLAIHLFRVRAVEPSMGLDSKLILLGLVVLVGPWLGVLEIHGLSEDGRRLVLFLFVLIWVVDSVAYFTGRRWGRDKLAPVLSPGKTLVGVYGGLSAAAACGALLAWGMGLGPSESLLAVALCALTAFISVVGDLFESLLKRRRGLKDSGRLLPGHGGILDRIDSLTAAAPVFAVGLLWLGVDP